MCKRLPRVKQPEWQTGLRTGTEANPSRNPQTWSATQKEHLTMVRRRVRGVTRSGHRSYPSPHSPKVHQVLAALLCFLSNLLQQQVCLQNAESRPCNQLSKVHRVLCLLPIPLVRMRQSVLPGLSAPFILRMEEEYVHTTKRQCWLFSVEQCITQYRVNPMWFSSQNTEQAHWCCLYLLKEHVFSTQTHLEKSESCSSLSLIYLDDPKPNLSRSLEKRPHPA